MESFFYFYTGHSNLLIIFPRNYTDMIKDLFFMRLRIMMRTSDFLSRVTSTRRSGRGSR